MNALLYAVRAFRRNRGLAIVSVITLAFGIGAATTIFSIVNAILLRPLPYPEPDRLAVVLQQWEGEDAGRVSPAEAFDYSDRLKSVEHLGFYADGEASLTGDGAPEAVPVVYQSHGVFPALGVAPLRGRYFTAEEDGPGTATVAVISHRLWRDRFGSDPSIAGKSITVNGVARTIVGVMPPEFRHPVDLFSDERPELFMPLNLDRSAIQIRGSHFLDAVARVRSGVSVDTASSEIGAVAASFSRELPNDYPAGMEFGASMRPMHDHLTGPATPLLTILVAAVVTVLLIACANVANLLLLGAEARRRDLAVRLAMGASRRHLLLQFLTESLLLGVAGGLAGLSLAAFAVRVAPSVLPSDLPTPNAIGIDWRVALFAMALSVGAALLTALVPVLSVREDRMEAMLREEGRSATGDASRRRFRRGLVMAEVALAVLLSLGAGLLLRTLGALNAVDPGFRTEDVLTFSVQLPVSSYPEDSQIVSFYQRLITQLEGRAEITSAGAVTKLPLGSSLGDLGMQIEGRFTPDDEPSRRADWQAVTPGYFETVGMRIVRGRGIEARDHQDSPGAVVINESLAEQYWPGSDPIGTRLLLGGDAGPGWVTIVGIVNDIRHADLTQPPRPEMYIPHAQFRVWGGGSAVRGMRVVVKGAAPSAMVPAARSVVGSIDSNLPVSSVETLGSIRSQSVARPRFAATLFGGFSAVALLMAAIGVYGVLAFLVSKRTREIAIRMALGAKRAEILRMVMVEGLRLTLPGVLAGLAAAVALSRGLEMLLYGVKPLDPASFAATAGILVLVALAAAAVPAMRASRVPPSVALRE